MLPGGLRDSADSGRGSEVREADDGAGRLYDEIADWYEHEFLAANPPPPGGPIRSASMPRSASLLGRGTSGLPGDRLRQPAFHAGRVRGLGWTPLGIDISHGDAAIHPGGPACPAAPRPTPQRLPVREPAALPAVIHRHGRHTGMPAYPAVLTEAAPGSCRPGRAVFVHVGVHPCFLRRVSPTGATPAAVVIRPRLPGGPTGPRCPGPPAASGPRARRHSPFPCPASCTAFLKRRPDPRTARRRAARPTPATLAIPRTQAPMNPGQVTHGGAPSQLPPHTRRQRPIAETTDNNADRP